MAQNIFDETVDTLIKDAKILTEKYNSYVNAKTDPENYVLTSKMSLDTLRLLKDTLSLIKEYDWHLEYENLQTDMNEKIVVWEQNHSGEIRNKKEWIVGDGTTMYIDYGTDVTLVYVGRRKFRFDLKKDKATFIYTITNYYKNGDITIYVDGMGLGKYVCDLLDSHAIPYKLVRNMNDGE